MDDAVAKHFSSLVTFANLRTVENQLLSDFCLNYNSLLKYQIIIHVQILQLGKTHREHKKEILSHQIFYHPAITNINIFLYSIINSVDAQEAIRHLCTVLHVVYALVIHIFRVFLHIYKYIYFLHIPLKKQNKTKSGSC